MAKVCISKEFTHWALNQTSPIIGWLRALARSLHHELGGPGVGAIGMCFSGGFALGMMVDDVMVAPVLSQPSLPFAIGKGPRRGDLNLSPDDRAGRSPSAPLTAARCSACGSPATSSSATASPRCASCSATPSSRSSCRAAHRTDHSVLTEQRDEASVTTVIEFLQAKLQ